MKSLMIVSEPAEQEKIRNVRRVMYFPLVLVVAWFFATVNRLYLFSNYDNPSLFLTIMHNMLGNLVGLMNCCVYGLNYQVKATFRESCRQCFPCISSVKEDEEAEQSQKV